MFKKAFIFLICLSIFIFGSIDLLVAEEFTTLPSPILMEHLTQFDIDSATRTINNEYNLHSKEQNNKLFFLRIHTGSGVDPYKTDQSNFRGSLYFNDDPDHYSSSLQLIANGKSDRTIVRGDIYESWPKIIDYGLKNQKNLAVFSLKENKDSQLFEMICQVTEKELLNNKNLNIFAISYVDWADNTKPIKPDKNGVIDVTFRNIAQDFPFGGKGERIQFDKNGFYTKKFKLPRTTKYNRQLSGIILGLQDMTTKEVVATGLCRFAEFDGKKEPTYFNWGNLPESIWEKDKKGVYDIKKEVIKNIGPQEMIFNLKNTTGKNIKHIELEISPNTNDEQYYDIIGYKINPELKNNVESVEFNLKTSRIGLTFKEPINSDGTLDIFTFITYFKKNNLNYFTSVGFPVKNIIITDIDNALVYFDGNNIQTWFSNYLVIGNNPFDLNDDNWVNNKDLEEFMLEFGTEKSDKDFRYKYDFCKDDRINLLDFLVLKKEIERQDKLMQIVKELNPDFKP